MVKTHGQRVARIQKVLTKHVAVATDTTIRCLRIGWRCRNAQLLEEYVAARGGHCRRVVGRRRQAKRYGQRRWRRRELCGGADRHLGRLLVGKRAVL